MVWSRDRLVLYCLVSRQRYTQGKMVGLLNLPFECIVSILVSLPPREIARCRLVSRVLWTIINDSPMLQYLLELDSLGLVPPRIISHRLPLEQKIQTLRRRKRTNALGICDTIAAPLHWQDDNVPSFGYDFVSSRGVLALKSQKKIEIHQLSSPNRNIGSSYHLLDSLPEHWMMAIEPAFDLLVLFDSTNNDVTFHLRSLQTGLAHPDACLPTVVYEGENDEFIRPGLHKLQIEIIGHRIAYLRECPLAIESTSRVIIWDWTSGQILTSTNVSEISFGFLSENVFIVATPISYAHGPDAEKKPSLLLYSCDHVPQGESARLTARFSLPMGLSTVAFRDPQFLSFSQPSFWYFDVPVTCPSQPVIYDLPPDSSYLALNPSFYRGSNTIRGTLFVHVSSLLAFATRPDHDNAPIPWSKWESTTAWVDPPILSNELRPYYGPTVFGHLVAYIYAEEQSSSWRVEVHDLRKATRTSLGSKTFRSFVMESYRPLKHDSLVKSFVVPFETVPPIRVIMGVWDILLEIMLDGEHVIILRRPSEDTQSSIHVYPLW
ncbi:unnamed protein product [Rhizoctonia solani]|uniref:F-box domain-containing protein n=1 Tax=Rhizoctonia solani TaxID=456999 RepID=A0A8H3CEN2_9AGAM|nr:unnamed protein product [Rhizoctonia solani]